MSSEFEISNGTVVYEIDIFLSSDSGRPKHTDVEGQGEFLIWAIERGLRSLEPGDTGFGMLRYVGAGTTGRPVLAKRQIGPYVGPFPGDDDRDRVYSLQGVIRALSTTVHELLELAPDREAAWQSLAESHVTRDAAVVVLWSTTEDASALDELEMTEWRDALLWHP